MFWDGERANVRNNNNPHTHTTITSNNIGAIVEKNAVTTNPPANTITANAIYLLAQFTCSGRQAVDILQAEIQLLAIDYTQKSDPPDYYCTHVKSFRSRN